MSARDHRNAQPAVCPRRPKPFRCDTCPVTAWPPASAGENALRDFVRHAKCPHDYQGGPVEWEPPR